MVEVVSIALGYLLYSLVRMLAPTHLYASYAHAYDVLNLERATGLFHELRLNAYLSHHELLEDLSSYWYNTAHFVVTPLVLVWLFRHRPRLYPTFRSALVLATVTALVVYATWPLAPPRLVIPGTIDVVVSHPVLWARGGAAGFVNEFAAMPSLHVCWAVWCAAVMVALLRTPWRHLAWLYPATTTLVVLATANHYVLDTVAGVAVALVPLALCGVRPRHLLEGIEVPPGRALGRRAPGAPTGTAGRAGAIGATST
jgi:hypothetical protein